MNQELTLSFITALTGSPDTICDWRIINDRDKGDYGKNIRGSYAELAATLQQYNSAAYGIFMCVNALKPEGARDLKNIDYIRTHVADVDNVLISQESYQRAITSPYPPHFAVQTSPGKYHLYWLTNPYQGNDFYKLQQRKIIQLYSSDASVIDATRVLRVPGFYHCKNEPKLVTCWGIYNGPKYNFDQIEQWLQNVNIVETFGNRSKLGDPDKAAPSLEWLNFALFSIDPNSLPRMEWLATSGAYKQAGWNLTTEEVLFETWKKWCSNFVNDNSKENRKLWNSLEETQCGWSRFQRITNVNAYMQFAPAAPAPTPKTPTPTLTPEPVNDDEVLSDVILDTSGKQKYFKNCFFIEREGKIFSPTGRFMNQTQFNGKYGGKEFCIRAAGGKTTDEAWKAALRSTDWTIPKVDHCRFLPQQESFKVVVDDMGRKGLNTYIPTNIKTVQGDVSPWLDYLSRIFNTPSDVEIFSDYLAHCIKYPGWKIAWSVLLQSAKGIGKQMIGEVIRNSIGENYTYQPDAEELVSGVSQFNGWMKNKIMFIVDEVRVGDRNDLMNGLKTIITDRRVAIESKGVDQEMEDNVGNWVFFSNFKDAFPIDENERRYCIFYSKLQSAQQIQDVGLTKDYFDRMYRWLEMENGYAIIAWYYKNYPIERGGLSHRAPQTSSYEEVLKIGRSPLRILLDEKVDNNERGFRAGYVSFVAYQKAVHDACNIRTKPNDYTLKAILETKGYYELGYTAYPIPGEDFTKPSLIYGLKGLRVDNYERSQI